MQEKAQRLQLQNVTLSGPVPYGELPNYIRKADLCLGIFGTTNKAQRVIPHKVFDYVACGAKVITERSPAICELYEDGKEVILCNPGDGRDLADKILAIHG